MQIKLMKQNVDGTAGRNKAQTELLLKNRDNQNCELPETPYFVAKQAENSLKKDCPSCFFIQRDDILNHNDCVKLHPLPGEELSSGVPEHML
ncbi:hypothetical protein Ahy_A07g031901 [Arachis hypogaea]|uniref:Uncharacterized protein n=1 Tax=Arachis hypogaea TaxID=3818 RepID=A0A445C5B1_ARAHY|nr:hypothetical protein Ahy_A07g031901 [Arachis hypogaea]